MNKASGLRCVFFSFFFSCSLFLAHSSDHMCGIKYQKTLRTFPSTNVYAVTMHTNGIGRKEKTQLTHVALCSMRPLLWPSRKSYATTSFLNTDESIYKRNCATRTVWFGERVPCHPCMEVWPHFSSG